MNGDPLQPCGARLDALERVVPALEARVAAIEGAHQRVTPAPASLPAAAPAARTPSHPSSIDAVALLTLIGRTLMVLAGAYLLRALTESAVWPASIGVTSGFAYAATWLGACERAARQDRRIHATFHGEGARVVRV